MRIGFFVVALFRIMTKIDFAFKRIGISTFKSYLIFCVNFWYTPLDNSYG